MGYGPDPLHNLALWFIGTLTETMECWSALKRQKAPSAIQNSPVKR